MRDIIENENYQARDPFNSDSSVYKKRLESLLKYGLFSEINLNSRNFNIKLSIGDINNLIKLLINLLNYNKLNTYLCFDEQYINNIDSIYNNNSSILRIEYLCSKNKTYVNFNFDFDKSLSDEYYFLIDLILGCVIKETKIDSIYMVKIVKDELFLNDFNFKEKILNVKTDYNDDFNEIDEKIKSFDMNTTGLVLLHSNPGCGKTSYISHLCNHFKKDRKVIYIPSTYLNLLNDSRLHDLLYQHKNSIIILEDSEEVLLSRDNNRNGVIQTLLNYTDGILADIFKPIFICTFNSDISKIDKALLRKGRCIVKYEFKPLERSKAQKLSDRLGYKTTITQDMTLADIYNQDEPKYDNIRKEITGFKLKSA